MKECENCKQGFPEVRQGDVVSLGYSRGYYLVTNTIGEKRLFSLSSGNVWNSRSLWGSLHPSEVEVVEVCYKRVD